MTEICKARHFAVHELVHPDIMREHGEDAWQLLDKDMLQVIDHLRDIFGPCTVNDYGWGGRFINSGMRVDFGSPGSGHRQHPCMAFDLKFKNASVAAVHQYIRDYQERMYKLGLRRVEHFHATPTWVHVDKKSPPAHVQAGEIYFFKP